MMVDTGSTPLLSKDARRTLVAGLSAPILAFALFAAATINQNASWEKLFSAASDGDIAVSAPALEGGGPAS